MNQLTVGSIRLGRVAGITVYLHWTWFLVAYLAVQVRAPAYHSPVWALAEYVTLFGIVLLHEFGHAIACRLSGGIADQIVLWPLGGVAYVNPPPRPGPVLASIVAGPLVNLLLVPPTLILLLFGSKLGLFPPGSDLLQYVFMVTIINVTLLVFNLLPVYPLDGGQILQAILWFFIGRARSLLIVSAIGVVVGVGVTGVALLTRDTWLAVMAVFVAFRSFVGFQQARILARVLQSPRHTEAACPFCHEAPLKGDYWICSQCGARFDTFDHHAVCPNCFERFPTTICPLCRHTHPIDEWYVRRPAGDQPLPQGRGPEPLPSTTPP